MQANQLSLTVDPLNNETTQVETYDRYDEYQNRTIYIGAASVPEDRDLLGLYRTFPTKSGNFKGVSKSAIKFTRDTTVPGVDETTSLTSPIIFEVSASVPVGATTADVEHARQRVIALLDDSTFMNSLNIQLMV